MEHGQIGETPRITLDLENRLAEKEKIVVNNED